MTHLVILPYRYSQIRINLHLVKSGKQGVQALTKTKPIVVTEVSTLAMLLLLYVVEVFDFSSSQLPPLKWFVPKPKGELAKLQPAVFSVSSHMLGTDALARKSVEDVGLGYWPACTILQGVAAQVLHADSCETKTASHYPAAIMVKCAKSIATAARELQGKSTIDGQE